ncbi:MAG: ABC transporter permease [Chloroflexi bacterium]|jgi:simple sugar transport system permease protein|uniref:ABC transporter permease n=1 Tax=Candidatus Roseilinea sp. NK_OTU-006 TaxID=2704250 RepID=UPI000F1D3619|nr:ABC transporter permease [Candidatus Roseilinea sp. NK_OTU-006]RMG63471.1 MAG: ABC transporter permease [Chloroflexota bacterium]
MTSQETARQSAAPWVRLVVRDGNLLRLFIACVLIFVVMTLLRPEVFPTVENFRSMGSQFPEVGVLAVAIMIAMLTGGIDLSVVSIANLSGVLAALFIRTFIPAEASDVQVVIGLIGAVVIAFAVGMLCGLLNGLLVARVNLTPILATLGTMTLYTGITVVITRGNAVFAENRLTFIGNTYLFGVIPIPMLIFAVVVAVFSVILNRTAFGLKLYLIGTNEKAARFSGIDVPRTLIGAYVLSGLLAAVVAMIFLGRNNSAKWDFAPSYVLQAILVAVLAGVNPAGGSGRLLGIVLAILALQFVSTGLNMLLLAVSGGQFFKEFAWGALLLIIMVINYFSERRK